MKNQKAGQNRNQPKCREALPLTQVQHKHGLLCLSEQFWMWIPPFRNQRRLAVLQNSSTTGRSSRGDLLWPVSVAEGKGKASAEVKVGGNQLWTSGWTLSASAALSAGLLLPPCRRSPTCAALPVCLNKKADKEYLSVSSIWSPRLFESMWVYLAGHADSLWAIYHDKKLQRLAPCQCLPFSSLPPPLSPLLGIDATSKQTSSSHSNGTFLYNPCMGTLLKPLDNPLQAR